MAFSTRDGAGVVAIRASFLVARNAVVVVDRHDCLFVGILPPLELRREPTILQRKMACLAYVITVCYGCCMLVVKEGDGRAIQHAKC